MSPQAYQGGPSPLRGDEAQAPQGANGGPHVHGAAHGGYGHGYAPYGPPPWGAYPPPRHAAYLYPHGHPFGPYGPGFAWGPPAWGPPAAAQDAHAGTEGTGLLNNRFVMGMLVGGALTYVLTNEAIQRAAIRGIMQVWLSVQGGLEEAKERFRDAESEIKSGRGG